MQTGFHHSRKRIVLEVGAIIAFLAAVIWGVLALAGTLAAAALPIIPTSADARLGEALYPLLAPEARRCKNPEPAAFVNALAKPLVDALGETPYAFEFVVVADDTPNAFALPGGKVAVHMGLLTFAQTPDEVAGVLAHEISHATGRHTMRNIAEGLGGTAALGLLLGWVDLSTIAGPALALSQKAYSRDLERDADAQGRALLLRARIDPWGMSEFFQRLKDQHGDALPPAILSTHPDPGDRAQAAASGPEPDGPLRALPALPRDLKCETDTAEVAPAE